MTHQIVDRKQTDHTAVNRDSSVAVEAAGQVTAGSHVLDITVVDDDLAIQRIAAVDGCAVNRGDRAAVDRDVRRAGVLLHGSAAAEAGDCPVCTALDRDVRIRIISRCIVHDTFLIVLIAADHIDLAGFGRHDAFAEGQREELREEQRGRAFAVLKGDVLKGGRAGAAEEPAVVRAVGKDILTAGNGDVALVGRLMILIRAGVGVDDDDLTAVCDLADRFGHVTERCTCTGTVARAAVVDVNNRLGSKSGECQQRAEQHSRKNANVLLHRVFLQKKYFCCIYYTTAFTKCCVNFFRFLCGIFV